MIINFSINILEHYVVVLQFNALLSKHEVINYSMYQWQCYTTRVFLIQCKNKVFKDVF